MTASTHALRGRRRGALAALAGALLAGTLASLPSSPAEAAPPTGPSLKWNISSLFQSRLTNKLYTNGALRDGSNVFWTGGQGTRDTVSGVTSISYHGTVVASRNRAYSSSEGYTLSISDPQVTIGDGGEGSISAVVGSVLLKDGKATTTTKAPKRVKMISFVASGANWLRSNGLDTLIATPDWSTQSFNPEFLAQIVSDFGTNDFTESLIGNWGNDPTPAAFSASLASAPSTEPTTTPTTTTPTSTPTTTPTTEPTTEPTAPAREPSVTFTRAMVGGDLVVTVAGREFTGVTQQNDDGVWVGVVPSSTDLETIEPEDAYPYALAHVPASAINATTGAFTARLTIRRSNLRLDTEYSLVTWQATEHSNTSQDTMTPLLYVTSAPTDDDDDDPTTIVYNGAVTPPYIQTTPTKYGAPATVKVRVPEVTTGSVTLKVDGKARTAKVNNGVATFPVGRLGVGSHALAATYVEANGTPIWFIKGTSTNVLQVTRATPKVAVKVTKRPTGTKPGRAAVTVTGVAGMTKPSGRVLLTLFPSKGKKTKVVGWAKNGRATIKLPALRKGTYRITVRYYGSTQYTIALNGGRPTFKVTK